MALPDENRITYFALTDARNKRLSFGIKAKDRTKHTYVIGKTGMGKSTLLENMAIQDIQNGEGLAFIDPHGKTAEYLLDFVPEHRMKDVLYFAPFDMEHPIAFNVMEEVGADKRHLVVSGLMSAFKKIWEDAWSARMEYILQNTIMALLEYPGATMMGINKMFSDKEFRKKVVDNVSDPTVKSFWVDEFAKYTERFAAEATPAIQNKVGQFTSNPLIRNIIGQSESSFDLRQIMDEKKILIINLSKGRLGEGNANLLGSMLITKIYLAAMSRADASERLMAKLPNFYLYVDEFQSFANESFADILSEARKYKLNLTVAHQYIEQMSEEVRAAIFGNVGTMIVFRVGPIDAELFEKEFMPTFIAEDLVNLGIYQMYLKLMIDGVGSQPFSAVGMPPIERPIVSFKEQVIEMSRKQYSAVRKVVEDDILNQMAATKVEVKKPEIRADFHSEIKKDIAYHHTPKVDTPRESVRFEVKPAEKKEEKAPYQPPASTVNTAGHLDGLRRTLAGVLGETDLSGPKAEPKISPAAPPILAAPTNEPKPAMAPQAPSASLQPHEKISQGEPYKSSIRPAPPSPNLGNTAHTTKPFIASPNSQKIDTQTSNRLALQAVLSQLKQKETTPTLEKKEAPIISDHKVSTEKVITETPPANLKPVHKGAEIPERDLREMLRVEDSKHEEKK